MHDVALRDTPAARLGTRCAFFASGFGMACWAPLVPYAKTWLGLDDAAFGLVLLGLGVGSTAAMPLAGAFVARHGSRPMILTGGLTLAAVLPLLSLVTGPLALAASLTAFGAGLGAIDVAMNVHASEVERAAGRPLMSGFHGLFSLGELAGAGLVTGLLWAGIAPLVASLAGSAIVLAATVLAMPRLLRTRGGPQAPSFAAPRGLVIVLGLMAFAAFLTEGAMVDWSGLFLIQVHNLPPAQAGLGFALVSVAMVVGRFAGDRVIASWGGVRVVAVGGGLVALGVAWLLLAPASIAAAGFLLVGLGAATRVPILFSAAGRQRAMPAPLAIAAMVMIGYVGVLAGPALIGVVAQATSLSTAFVLLAVLMLLVPIRGRVAASLEGTP